METPCYPFIGSADLDALQIPELDRRWRLVRLANPLSEEQPYLRTTLLPGLLAAALRNISRGTTDLALFEHGSAFFHHGRETSVVRPSLADRPAGEELAALEALLPDQPDHLALVVTGDWSPAGWWGPARGAGWADVVGAVQRVAAELGADLPWRPGPTRSSTPGDARSSASRMSWSVTRASCIRGWSRRLGCQHGPRWRRSILGICSTAASGPAAAPTVGTMPVAKEDVALVVDLHVPAAAVAAALRSGGGELLESVRLFDEFRGTQVGEGKKSLAYSLRFRAPDRTLTTEEVAAARDAAVAAAGAATGAVLRG